MDKFTSKKIKNDCYFVLYDFNDFPVCYFDNFDELSRHINYSSRRLAILFNAYGNLLHICIGGIMYKLFATEELENFN